MFKNTESTQRQYASRQRAVVLGWPAERIEIIDCDQGQSGASTAEREGFQKLVAEVGLGKAGIDWKSRAWRATVPTGTVCWRSAR